MIVAIDGPAGSGKSSTARAVARRLGFHHLDSGAFYRTLTLAALRAGIPAESWPRLGPDDLEGLAVSARPADRGYRFFVAGEDVTEEIRAPEVNAHVSRMARIRAVRQWLLAQLRRAAEGQDLVADGRDMGTVVFPHADLKIFLTASPETRARRRLAERDITDPDPDTLRAETERLLERDRIDSEREVAPLRRADNAVLIDTTGLGFAEQVDRVVQLIEARRRSGPGRLGD
ncbi:MAG: (d)CMP kinase [Gemmatimonadetes bacterium]|nr:(d)CMP kinase [Gemmatimonadota bacterium]